MRSASTPSSAKLEGGFDAACSLLDAALRGSLRQEIVAEASRAQDFGRALLRLRDGMRANAWKAGEHQVDLARMVGVYDARTRREDGFHALHDWDGIADHVNADIIPVDVLNYLLDRRGAEPVHGGALAILLDYYFLHLLALLSLRVWDEDDADANLDRLDRLLAELQGPNGGGQPFAANAETLILIATAHFEIEERGFGTLLDRVRTLNRAHRANVAVAHAASLGSHLRFGFEATYGRDTVAMRDDNMADYPWLSFALATVMDEYARMRAQGIAGVEREAIVEALLNGLSPDARAFVGDRPPASLKGSEAERVAFRDRFHEYRQDLLAEFERYRPSDQAYSPLAFFFNFSHNVLKGTVIDALIAGEAWDLTLNDLLTGLPEGDRGQTKEALATTLMAYARANPHKIRGRLMPVIVYDPWAGRRAFGVAMRKLRE